MDNTRNSFLVLKAMRSFLFATILASITLTLCIFIANLFAGNYLGANAVSAINLFTPVSIAIDTMFYIFAAGTFVLYSKYLGERNHIKLKNTFVSTFICLIAIGLVFTIAFLLFGKEICSLFCTEHSIFQEFYEFSKSFSITVTPNFIAVFLSMILVLEGKPQVSINSSLIILIVNLVLDTLFIGICHFSIAFLSYSICIAYVCVIFYQSRFLIKDYKYLFSKLLSSFSLRSLINNVKESIPKTTSYVCSFISIYYINLYVQNQGGTDGLFAWSVYQNIHNIVKCLVLSLGSCILSLGTFYKGQKDNKGLNFIVKRSNLFLALVVAFALGLLLVFSGGLASIFGANSVELVNYTKHSLLYIALFLPGVMLSFYMFNYFQLKGNMVLSSICPVFYPVVTITTSLFTKSFSNPWMLFPISGFALLLIFGACIILRKKNEAGTEEAQNTFDISIKADKDSVKSSLGSLNNYLKGLGLDHLLVFKINVCVEEVMINIVEYSGANMSNHYFDVHIAVLDKKVVCSIKNDSKAFNPTFVSEDKRGMGLKIIFALCPNIEYKYMYGQNMSYLSWEKD